ncbi:EAL domain-containing protein [Tepidimonas charontis]|uniref:Putative signaling protein n=1 Tax=Tepidimonas charontis TaxID=2267262 RepID=A0A554XF18_9BURK|nr:EAL domain-containing protein [Tepidimonas charontis]TSE34430.1 putative signaling protein [Tepidimonas charontis]
MPPRATYPIAILGASAGALEPLRELLAALPGSARLAIIVAQHLSGQEPSALVHLLQSVTPLKVKTAPDGVRPAVGTVLVIPPGCHAEWEHGRLRLYPVPAGASPAPSIDRLLSSAATLGPRVVAIILSGTGQDGAVGARAVRHAGGSVWAEQPQEAPFASMPQAIIARGLADHVDNAAGLGHRLATLAAARVAPTGPASSMAGETDALAALITQVSQHTGIDLADYQKATLRRQFERVMRQEGLPNLAALQRAVERRPELLATLAQSVTIGVTAWLRDPSAFAALRVALRERIAARTTTTLPIRLWSVGCSTGEEAYTLAMLLDDLLRELRRQDDWMVLGTDVNAQAIEQARSGMFDAEGARALPAAWRERYFVRIGQTLRVTPDLRRHCVFTRHDVLRELPFLRMDLAACRNVLIYLQASAKEQVLAKLHFALQPDGLLLLGHSESLTARTRTLFAPVVANEHLWRRREGERRGWRHGSVVMHRAERPATALLGSPARQLRPADRLEADLHETLVQHLLRRHAPPTMLTDREGRLLHVHGDMAAILHWPEGSASAMALPHTVRREWQRDVRLAIQRLLSGTDELELPLPALADMPPQRLLGVRLDVAGDPYLLLSFAPVALPGAATHANVPPADAVDERWRLEQERQLSLIEALEQSQRQLQQLNESLSITSEELEAANEELESSNEELQVSNEELRTLNEELDRSLREQQQLSDLLATVQESLAGAILIIDGQGRLVRYNQHAAEWFGLREQHLGLPLRFDRRRFPWPADLGERLERDSAKAWQQEIEQPNGRYLLHIAPWRTADERHGTVLTVTDMSALQRAEHERLELQTRLSALTDALHEAVLLLQPASGRLLYASARLTEWLGTPNADGAALIERIHPEDRPRVLARWQAQDDDRWTQRYRLLRDGAGILMVQERCSRIRDGSGGERFLAASLLDITDLIELERREAAVRARLQAVWSNPAVGVAVLTPEGLIQDINDALAALLGAASADLRGRAWRDFTAEPDRAEDAVQWQALLRGQPVAALEKRLHGLDGTQHWARQYLHMAHHPDPVGTLVVAMIENIEDVKVREQTIFRQANYDPLTGLPNRNLFRDRLEQTLLRARRDMQPVYVMFIDLDGFKEVNDVYGHEAGDALLAQMAERFRRAVRANDTVARFGGDEFVVLLDGAETPMVAERVGDVLLHAARQPVELAGTVQHLTASIGIAAYPNDGETVEELLRMADTAMYTAKNSGRDRLRFYSPHMESRARRQAEIKVGLEEALAQSQFELHFQPLVMWPQPRVVGVEALLRWRHPTRGLVAPSEFIPVAETTGQIRRIGGWALREAGLRALEAAQRWGPPFRVSINLSAAQFGDAALEAWLNESQGLLPHLTLEVTESTWMDDNPITQRWLQRVRAGGALVALDDFGTGYSSLSYLMRAPVDELKIDKSFTDHLGSGGPSERIVAAVLDVAQALRASVVVEGVETRRQLDFLRTMGPMCVQGYCFARPMPWEQLVAWMDAFDGQPNAAQ